MKASIKKAAAVLGSARSSRKTASCRANAKQPRPERVRRHALKLLANARHLFSSRGQAMIDQLTEEAK